MRRAGMLAVGFAVAAVTVVGAVYLCSPTRSAAQSQGNNTVWASSTGTSGSAAFIDASTCTGSGCTDICTTINAILTSSSGFTYPAQGAVVDARGIAQNSTTALACSVNPFNGVTVPSTILLPASTILLQTSWVLPSNTRIIGEGNFTVLGVGSWSGGSDLIDMCSTSSACSGVSIEHLKIQGEGNVNCSTTPSTNTYNGIVNNYAQVSSFVSDVTMCDIGGTGLKITSNAGGSGPYTNIDFVAAPGASGASCSGGLGTPCTACVDIEAQTLGLHGVTCVGASDVSGANGSSMGDAAIYVNAGNNSIEDIHVEEFWDAVEVGDISSTVGNVVISNLRGSYNQAKVTN